MQQTWAKLEHALETLRVRDFPLRSRLELFLARILRLSLAVLNAQKLL